jgi:hypothetical protein
MQAARMSRGEANSHTPALPEVSAEQPGSDSLKTSRIYNRRFGRSANGVAFVFVAPEISRAGRVFFPRRSHRPSCHVCGRLGHYGKTCGRRP